MSADPRKGTPKLARNGGRSSKNVDFPRIVATVWNYCVFEGLPVQLEPIWGQAASQRASFLIHRDQELSIDVIRHRIGDPWGEAFAVEDAGVGEGL